MIDFTNPLNCSLLEEFRRTAQPKRKSEMPFRSDSYDAGVHPDLIDRLEEIGTAIDPLCFGEAYGYPVLSCPNNGVIYATASGTHTLLFRVSVQQQPAIVMLSGVSTIYFGNFGVLRSDRFGEGWFLLDNAWGETSSLVCRMAYENACFIGL